MDLSEVRWIGQGDTVYGNYTMFYSGGNIAERELAIMMKNKLVNSVIKT